MAKVVRIIPVWDGPGYMAKVGEHYPRSGTDGATWKAWSERGANLKVAVTGGTGFIGHYLLQRLGQQNYEIKAWYRSSIPADDFDTPKVDWIPGHLEDQQSMRQLVEDCDCVVHSALWKPGSTFRGGEGDVARFAEVNIIGTLQLIQASMEAGVGRFVFISTCAVHEKILDDRPLDEAHPLWPLSHYGAHKAAIEKFVCSYGVGGGYPICALRPTGVYGLHHRPEKSKWYAMIEQIVKSNPVKVSGGGKEVHAADVARAVEILLQADGIRGQAYNCYDQYVSQWDVAQLAKQAAGSNSEISGQSKCPQHQIDTSKIRSLGMDFGGQELLTSTICEIVDQIKSRM